MQQVRSNRDSSHESTNRGTGPLIAVRTDLSTLLNDYTSSQKNQNDRLESLEREIASLKGSVKQAFVPPSNEHEVNRAGTTKKSPTLHPISNRSMSAPRIPSTMSGRKVSNDEQPSPPIVSTNDGPFSRPLPLAPVNRSRSFNDNTLHPPSSPLTNNAFDETNLLRSHKAHLEQVLRKDAPQFTDVRIPNYISIEDVLKSNEQLLLENDRLRSELNRLRTESILLLRSMRSPAGNEPNLGNERISAERERQELAIELARQVEENKRLRRSLLSQSAKFVTLRQLTNPSEASLQTFDDHHNVPKSAPHPTLSFNKSQQQHQQQSKPTRLVLANRGHTRTQSFNHGSHDPFKQLFVESDKFLGNPSQNSFGQRQVNSTFVGSDNKPHAEDSYS
ncbi:unnamed protein product [Adineta steineri]|uniref:Uncharacterized protein n=2 Tax=Adineta steineri TaxID=433720 RepID=A0A814I536_9BILA|nr:unnamed protein product [Adineta steineri]